jgi:hypothetical protein
MVNSSAWDLKSTTLNQSLRRTLKQRGISRHQSAGFPEGHLIVGNAQVIMKKPHESRDKRPIRAGKHPGLGTRRPIAHKVQNPRIDKIRFYEDLFPCLDLF